MEQFNIKVLIGVVGHGILTFSFYGVRLPDPLEFLPHLLLVGLLLNVIGLGLIISGNKRAGGYINNVGAIVFVPLGFISFKGGIEELDAANREEALPEGSSESYEESFYAVPSKLNPMFFLGPTLIIIDIFMGTGFLAIGGGALLYRASVRKTQPVVSFYPSYVSTRNNPFFAQQFFIRDRIKDVEGKAQKVRFNHRGENGVIKGHITTAELENGSNEKIEKLLKGAPQADHQEEGGSKGSLQSSNGA